MRIDLDPAILMNNDEDAGQNWAGGSSRHAVGAHITYQPIFNSLRNVLQRPASCTDRLIGQDRHDVPHLGVLELRSRP